MEPGLLVLVYSMIGIAAAVTAITLAGFNVDLAIASLFYDPATRQFSGQNAALSMVRDHGVIAVATCIGCIVLAGAKYLPWRLPGVPARTAVFLTLSLLLGPGLLVNGVLKEHWDRPRPVDVTQFGGSKPFVNWWNPTGQCERNCSFVSGEAATAAWMFGPAMLVPAPWRAAALAAAAAFTAAMSILRLSVGAHFFTDVLLGALSTMLILLAMRALVERIAERLAARGRPGGERPDRAANSRAQPTA
jgi:membrane-associated PAP2 superfamily phosphatase